jgi:hypothetical protein
MSEPLWIVSVINDDENTPDFVSRVRVGVRLCDLTERIPPADDCSEVSGFDEFFERCKVGAEISYGSAAERTNDLCRACYG